MSRCIIVTFRAYVKQVCDMNVGYLPFSGRRQHRGQRLRHRHRQRRRPGRCPYRRLPRPAVLRQIYRRALRILPHIAAHHRQRRRRPRLRRRSPSGTAAPPPVPQGPPCPAAHTAPAGPAPSAPPGPSPLRRGAAQHRSGVLQTAGAENIQQTAQQGRGAAAGRGMMLCLPALPVKGGKHRRRYSGGHRSHTSDAGGAARGGGRNSPLPHRKIMEWQALHRYAGKHCLLALRHVNDHAVSLLPPAVCKKNAVPFYGTAFSICH